MIFGFVIVVVLLEIIVLFWGYMDFCSKIDILIL